MSLTQINKSGESEEERSAGVSTRMNRVHLIVYPVLHHIYMRLS